ncbi:MAG: V-type ATP synthase subunit E family protein [Solirubrobacteraceae bacterium]
MNAVAQALEAVSEVDLHAASDEADAIRRTADRRAEEMLSQARAEAADLVARRCDAADRLAELEERERLADARAKTRGMVLRAQRSVLDDARAAAHRAVGDLAGDVRLERLLERVATDAHQRLATAGTVEVVAVPDGGFIARAGSREIDYSLRAQVDRVVDAMAIELERLWR